MLGPPVGMIRTQIWCSCGEQLGTGPPPYSSSVGWFIVLLNIFIGAKRSFIVEDLLTQREKQQTLPRAFPDC